MKNLLLMYCKLYHSSFDCKCMRSSMSGENGRHYGLEAWEHIRDDGQRISRQCACASEGFPGMRDVAGHRKIAVPVDSSRFPPTHEDSG